MGLSGLGPSLSLYPAVFSFPSLVDSTNAFVVCVALLPTTKAELVSLLAVSLPANIDVNAFLVRRCRQ